MSELGIDVSVTRRNFIRGLGLLSPAAALTACTQGAGVGSGEGSAAGGVGTSAPLVAIIHTNDTHGHDVEVEATDSLEGNFSMAAVPALRKEWEDAGYDVLVVDAGDATQGMPLVDLSSGETAITFMNACGYQAMALGNHEFDRGQEELAAYEELAEFPLLSANVLDAETGEPRFTPHLLLELSGGTKVGLFGLTTPSTTTTTKPEHVAGLSFLKGGELYDCAQRQVDELRAEGADLVVCLGHLGRESVYESFRSSDVLEHVSGIDLFVDGHDHELVEEEVAGTLLVETGCYLHNIGLVLIDEGVPSDASVAYGSFDGTDVAAQAVIDDIDARVAEELGVVIAHTDFFLDGNRRPGVRTQETNLGDLCSDAVLWAARESTGAEVDAAIVNGGGIRASVEEGDITLATTRQVFAFSNQVVVVRVSGAQLLEALEAGYQGVGEEEGVGAFSQVAGIELAIDTTVPYEAGELYPESTFYAPAVPGSRVTIHSVGGRPWAAEDTYSIATNDFIVQGGDTYHAFKEAADAETPVTCDFDYESLASYLIVACDHEVPARYADPAGEGRITIVL